MPKPIPISPKLVLLICIWTTPIVILIDFVFLNLGIDGLLNWRLHLITALYCFSITIVNFAYFSILNTKLDDNFNTSKRILAGLVGSVLVTLPTLFVCRFIHLVFIDGSYTPVSFIEKEKLEYYLFPLLIALVISLFIHAIFLLKAFQNNRIEVLAFNNFGSLTLNDIELAQSDKYSKHLIRLLSEDKCYQNPNLNLLMLSRKLGLSRRETSAVIQKIYKKPFSECVNDFRLEDVLHKFKNQKHQQYTIMALATEAGFASKSTFYRYFKKKIGLSPSEFLQQKSLPKPSKQ